MSQCNTYGSFLSGLRDGQLCKAFRYVLIYYMLDIEQRSVIGRSVLSAKSQRASGSLYRTCYYVITGWQYSDRTIHTKSRFLLSRLYSTNIILSPSRNLSQFSVFVVTRVKLGIKIPSPPRPPPVTFIRYCHHETQCADHPDGPSCPWYRRTWKRFPTTSCCRIAPRACEGAPSNYSIR